MNVDLNVYRTRIGSNDVRYTRLPHSKRLSSDQLLIYMLLAHYRLIGITMFILCQIMCKLPVDIATSPFHKNPYD
jgi:hypothetical protein